MIAMFGFGNLETECCFGRRVAAYRLKAEGMSWCMSVRSHTRAFLLS